MNTKYIMAITVLLAGTAFAPLSADAAERSYNGLTIGGNTDARAEIQPHITTDQPSVMRPGTNLEMEVDGITDPRNANRLRELRQNAQRAAQQAGARQNTIAPAPEVASPSDVAALRQARALEEAQEREARIERLNQMRDEFRAERQETLQTRSAGTDNPGGMTQEERFSWNQDKMALLNAYKERRATEIQQMQRRYQETTQ